MSKMSKFTIIFLHSFLSNLKVQYLINLGIVNCLPESHSLYVLLKELAMPLFLLQVIQ